MSMWFKLSPGPERKGKHHWWIASTLALTVTLMMATMEASMASSRSKEETTEKGDRAGLKRKCQNERRCHESTMALMVTSLASMVASTASWL